MYFFVPSCLGGEKGARLSSYSQSMEKTPPIAEMTMQAWLDALAQPTPTPAGGSAAAVAGAMAAALVMLACDVTLARQPPADRAARLNAACQAAAIRRQELLALAEADAQAFDRLMAARRLPKATPEEAATRQTAIAAAQPAVIELPCQAALASAAVARLAEDALTDVTPSVRGDLVAAALLAEACLRANQVNLTLNLAGVSDRQLAAQAERQMAEASEGIAAIRERMLAFGARPA